MSIQPYENQNLIALRDAIVSLQNLVDNGQIQEFLQSTYQANGQYFQANNIIGQDNFLFTTEPYASTLQSIQNCIGTARNCLRAQPDVNVAKANIAAALMKINSLIPKQ
jgi:hypothetical protein